MGMTEEDSMAKEEENTIGNRLKDLREQHQYTQDEVAEKMSVKRQAVSDWERDEAMPRLEIIKKLSELYGVSEEYLLGTKKEKQGFFMETIDVQVEKWKKDEKLRKTLLQIALAAVVVSSVGVPPLGLILSISTFILSRKWKVNTVWLNVVIGICIWVSLYGIFAILNHTVFDFGYSEVTPLYTE